ncbi:hypothetical protein ACJX0J_024057, partial [Zea mays]
SRFLGFDLFYMGTQYGFEHYSGGSSEFDTISTPWFFISSLIFLYVPDTRMSLPL